MKLSLIQRRVLLQVDVNPEHYLPSRKMRSIVASGQLMRAGYLMYKPSTESLPVRYAVTVAGHYALGTFDSDCDLEMEIAEMRRARQAAA